MERWNATRVACTCLALANSCTCLPHVCFPHNIPFALLLTRHLKCDLPSKKAGAVLLSLDRSSAKSKCFRFSFAHSITISIGIPSARACMNHLDLPSRQRAFIGDIDTTGPVCPDLARWGLP
ncbi:unnamed protein product [Durusdinium trenchii]|uniref:Secreted protein n=1 Tax=Durusdinium trenchii TaxID=1381693 RepID=A0ABP0JGP3_9DINO